MKDLIERLGKATGPDRELDAAIMRDGLGAETWFYDDNDHIDAQIKAGLWKREREEHPDFDPNPQVTWRYHLGDVYGEIPNYTGSADAALSLVDLDGGWLPEITSQHYPDGIGWEVDIGHMMYDATDYHRHRHLPIAICMAALNARDLLECADALPNPNAVERDMEAGR